LARVSSSSLSGLRDTISIQRKGKSKNIA